MSIHGGGAGRGFIGGTPYASFSPLDDPRFADYFQQLIGGIPQPTGIADFMRAGLDSPLLQMVMQNVISQLVPSERAGRSALTDRFRAAGALRDTAHGTAASTLESEILGRRGQATTSAMTQFLGPILQSLLAEQGQRFEGSRILAQLLSALRPEIMRGEPAPPMQDLGFRGSQSSWLMQDEPYNRARDPWNASRQPGSSSYDPYSPLNPGRTPQEKADYAIYGLEPGWQARQQTSSNWAGDLSLPGAGGAGGGGGRVRWDYSTGTPTIVNDPWAQGGGGGISYPPAPNSTFSEGEIDWSDFM